MTEVINRKDTDLFQSIVYQSLQIPGVRINRDEFLRRTLSKHFHEDVVNQAVKKNPASAGIKVEDLNRISKSCINHETGKVTSLSAVAGLPGKFGALVAIPADLTQYFAHVIRVMQKLIYLYGWEDVFDDTDGIDDETLSYITIFMGTMFGVKAANQLVQKIAFNAAVRANKVIAAKPLTKGVIYPIVRKIAISLSLRMNKKIFASGVSKMIPVAGAFTSGGLTYVTFRPLANRLKVHLESLPQADVNFYINNIDEDNDEIIIDVSDIKESDY